MAPIYTLITPRTAIEGYNDAFLTKMSQTPFLELGMMIDPWISIDTALYEQKNNSPITLNTGALNYTMTAQTVQIGSCTNCTDVMIPCKNYTSIYSAVDSYCNPYAAL
jgi:hypothetical protein